MKMIKKILSMILVISMLVGLSVSAFAAKKTFFSVKEIDVEVDGNYKADSVTVEIGDKSVSNTSYQQLEAEYDDEENEWELKFKKDKSWKLSQYPTKDNVVVYLNGTVVSVKKVELDEGELDIEVSAPVKTYTVTVNYVDENGNEIVEPVVAANLQKGDSQKVVVEDFEGYKFVKVEGASYDKFNKTYSVKVNNKDINVTVKYNKIPTYTVTVNYVDVDNTDNILATETYSMQKNDEQEIEFKTFPDYQLIDKKEFKCVDVVKGKATLKNNPVEVKCHEEDATVNVYYKAIEVEAPKTTNTTAEIKVFITGEHEKKSVSVTYGEYAADSGWVYESGKAAEGEADHWELDLHGENKWELPTELNAADFSVILDENEDLNVDVISVENRWDTLEREFELYINVVVEAKPETYNVTVTYVCDDESVELPADISESVEAGNFEFALPTIEGYEANVSVADVQVKDGKATITVNSDINVVVSYEEIQTDVPGGGEPEEEEPEIKPEQPEIKPEPVDPPKSTIDIHVHIENNYKPGKLTLDYGAGTIVESQFSNNYNEVLKCWVKPDVDPDSLPALETDNFEVTLNGYTAFVSDVVKDEDGNAVCIHVDVPDVVYVYVCVVDENGNIIEEDAPNAEAAKDVVRPYFKNVNSTKKYYTLGSISVDGLPAPVYNDHNKGKLSDEELEAQFEAYADLLIPGLEEKIDLYKVNWAEGADDAKIKEMMKDVTWNVLHVDNGANDYNLGTVNGKIKPAVWHLDGYLTLKAEEPTDPPAEETEEPVEPQKFTVTFVDHDGTTVLKTEEVEEGKAATAPTAPTHEGYTFNGWDKAFDKITESITVTAQCTENKTTGGNEGNEGGEGEKQPDNGGNDDTTGGNEDNNNNNNNNDDDVVYYPPTPDTPVGGGDETIVDEDVPLGGEPEGDETIEDEDVPLGDMPEEELEEIEDDEVPLDATPKTGNALRMIRNIAFAIAALSFSGLMASVVITKKKFDF